MATPTPTSTTHWDGWRGATRWNVAWTAAAADDLADTVIVDVSALSPIPKDNAIKVRRIDAVLNGDFIATLEWSDIATGTVNTATAGSAVTWVSGDVFDTNWIAENFGPITINSTEYTLSTIPTTTTATVSSDPGDQSAVAYTFDQTIDRFAGQSDATFEFFREYNEGPNGGLVPDKTSSSLVGDIILTTSGAADGDELNLYISFERA